MFAICLISSVRLDERAHASINAHMQTHGLTPGASAQVENREQGGAESVEVGEPMTTTFPVLSPSRDQQG